MVYFYRVPAGTGYDGDGNVLSYADSVMGDWSFSYDTLNRLSTATAGANVPAGYAGNFGCWSYDAFGNRLSESMSRTPCGSSPSPTSWANYDTNNRYTATSQAPGGVQYDAAGNVLNDGQNQYLYDGAGRVCAVASVPVAGVTSMTGYLYTADGQRVAKGSISAWSCNPAVNGFQTSSDYILGQNGEQMTEMVANAAGTGLQWQHTNVFAAGELIATYDNDGLHFYVNDPLGTRRMQTDYAGVVEQTCFSLPYGDGLNCTGSNSAPTEHHFTAKERDAESGNDYFGARYYSSAMGRFLSPDWSVKEEPVPYAKLDNPQTLNLYGYMMNDPLGGFDPDGHTVYLITYSTGNHAGDDDFYKAALTRQNEIMSQKGFDPTKDIALVEGVNSVKSFANAINDANGLESKFGKVGEVSLYGHGGKDGPIFQEAGPGGPSARFSNEQNPQAIMGLKVNWADGGTARFMSCQAAVPSTNYSSGSFAQEFANRQGVSTFGFNDRTTFSSTPVGKSYGYFFGGVNEYLVTWGKTQGRNVPAYSGPVKLDPQKK